LTANEEYNFNAYGVSGSTVRLAGGFSAGWLANAAVNPAIEIPSGQTFTLGAFSPSYANAFAALKGDGTFAITATANQDNDLANVSTWGAGLDHYSAYFRIGDVSGFHGSIATSSDVGVALGSTKPAKNTAGGKILVYANVTIASGKTWTASNGIVLGKTGVTLTNTDGALETAPTSGVENYKVVSAAGEGGTEYSLAVDGVIVDVEDGIIVTSDWLTDNGLSNATASDLTAARAAGENSNGYSYYACYALGLNPTKADDKPIVDVTVVDGNYVFTVKHPVYNEQGAIAGYEEINAADNVTTTVTLKYGTDANTQSWESAGGTSFAPNALPFGENNNVLYYKAEVSIGAK